MKHTIPIDNICMKMMIIIVLFCCGFNENASAISIRRQKGTFSEANLCKIGKGTIVRKARSSVECFVKCLILLPKTCKSVKYLPEEQICNMYDEGFRYDYYETENDSCTGYQMLQDTNNGLTTFKMFNKMFRNKCFDQRCNNASFNCVIVLISHKDLIFANNSRLTEVT